MGLSVNIAVSSKYAGPVNYGAALELCGPSNLYKMGSEYIAIEDPLTFELDSVVVRVGRRAESLLFSMVSALKMESMSRDVTKTIRVKKLSEKEAKGHNFTIYKVV